MIDYDSENVSSTRQTPLALARVGHWQGGLYLRYARSASSQDSTKTSAKTVLVERRHQGPYTVQRPFYPEGDVCHSILLHPPGGLVEGDVLSLCVDCDPGSHCFLTTPSAGKTYECAHDFAVQKQVFRVQDNAALEWFPQEMILYDRSKSDLRTEIRLYGTGQFVGWEMICLGRPVAGDYFSTGDVHQLVSLYRDDKPLLLERSRFAATHSIRSSNCGLAGYPAMGVFLMTGADKTHLQQARDAVDALDDGVRDQIQMGFTLLEDVLVGRVLMNQSRFAKTACIAVWTALREEMLNIPATVPRIWFT
ncbi:MAG: urease accessory protein UreD [Arenicella sp.]